MNRKILPKIPDFGKWLERKIARHEKWETRMFGMDWELHEDDEEWSWELYFIEPGTGNKLEMTYGVAHAKKPLNNFLVSELCFNREAWTAFETEKGRPDEERPRGWQIADALVQLTAFNVSYYGLNFHSVLAGSVERAKDRNGFSRFYFRPYGQWYSSTCSEWLPAWNGEKEGCEYLRPIPLSETSSEGESYLSVDDNVWDYVDVDVKPGQED